MNISQVREHIRGLGGPGSGQRGHTTEHDAAVAAHAQAQATHKAALEAHTGAFNVDASKTIGIDTRHDQTSDVKRVVNGDKKTAADIHTALTSRGFTAHAGRTKNQTAYGHKDGTIVSVTNQGKAGLLVQHIGPKFSK